MDKCLNFGLPSGAAGMAAGYTKMAIQRKLTDLVHSNKIGPYKTVTKAYTYKVWLEKEIDYTTFFLLWEPSNHWHVPTITYETYSKEI